MSKDYYNVLGVDRNADKSAIKKAATHMRDASSTTDVGTSPALAFLEKLENQNGMFKDVPCLQGGSLRTYLYKKKACASCTMFFRSTWSFRGVPGPPGRVFQG